MSSSLDLFCRERSSLVTGGYKKENCCGLIKFVHFYAGLLTSNQCRKDTCWLHPLCEHLSQSISNNEKVPDELLEVPEFYESERRIGCLLPFSLTICTWENSARILLMWSFLLCMESWRLISSGPYTTILDSFSCAAFYPDCSTNAYVFNQAKQFVVLSWFCYNMPYIMVWKKALFFQGICF